MMVGNRRAEEVVDPNLEPKPSTHALKRALLVALRCVDPDSEKRPKMSQVVRMLDADFPYREVLYSLTFACLVSMYLKFFDALHVIRFLILSYCKEFMNSKVKTFLFVLSFIF